MFNKVDEVKVATDLLGGAGLNRTAFARGIIGKEDVNPREKESTRKLFDGVFKLLKDKHGDNLYKDGHDFFLKKEDIKALQNQIVELKKQNFELKQEITKLNIVSKDVNERKQCLYKKGKGTRFYISEVEDKLKEGWKEHPND